MMRRILLPLCAALMICTALAMSSAALDQTLTQADRDKGVKYLQTTRDGVVASVKRLSDEQWKFKAAPDRWSVAETLEHIALAEEFTLGNITEKIMKAPAGAPDRDYVKIDAFVLTAIPDRSHKAHAPDNLTPTGRWTPAETLDHFLKSREKTIAYLESAQDLRGHVVNGPLDQPMDGYEWLIFEGAHSERHTKQIEEVKADPNFPKK
jgi:uncharacterized damage-inducible protein DinB